LKEQSVKNEKDFNEEVESLKFKVEKSEQRAFGNVDHRHREIGVFSPIF
jgi:hypothetical protein